MITYIRTSSQNSAFRDLVALLDKDLKVRDGDDHAFYSQFNKIDNIPSVIVCYENNLPVGCGAFKRYDDHKAEIKRMYVQPSFRGKGIAFNILEQLEIWAVELAYSHCILETGKNQPEAIGLYKKAGYQLIKNYGQYENVENSVCMMKVLI